MEGKYSASTAWCFVSGTKVHTQDGTTEIQNIETGDYVLSYDEETGETDYQKVVRLFRNTTYELAYVEVEGAEEIVCTPGHRFYVEREWIAACELEAGDVLKLSDGTEAKVISVEVEKLAEPEIIYNFEVENWHNYYVADAGVLVHNEECDTGDNVNWTNHGYKHFPDKSMTWKQVVKSTKNGPAKYHQNILDIEAFEKDAWSTGIAVTNGKNWKVKKYDTIIGATEGTETYYVRIESSADTIHGHPISEREYNKLLK